MVKRPIYISLILCQIAMILSNSIFDYTHDQGEPLSIQAGSLSSRKGIIPYGYTKLKICDSQKVIKAEDTLGEILTGEVLYTTDYIANTNEDEYCQVLCYNNFNENKRLKKEEDDKKFINELNKIKRKTLIRLEEEKKQKIYYMTNDIEIFKNNKRKSAIIPQKKNKDIEKLNNNKINKNKLKKSGTITDTKNERNEWMNQNKNNFFDDI